MTAGCAVHTELQFNDCCDKQSNHWSHLLVYVPLLLHCELHGQFTVCFCSECARAFICVCVRARAGVHQCVSASVCACVCVCVCVCVCGWVGGCGCVCVRARSRVLILRPLRPPPPPPLSLSLPPSLSLSSIAIMKTWLRWQTAWNMSNCSQIKSK